MNLNITPGLIHALRDHAERTHRWDSTGLALTADGWDTEAWLDSGPTGPVALTADIIYAYTDGEPLTDDLAAELVKPDSPDYDSYQVENEHGDVTTPRPDQDPQVVTGTLESGPVLPDEDGHTGEIVEDWRDAWWFDRNAARQIITEVPISARTGPRASSLHITPGGRYVMLTRSRYTGEAPETWTEITPTRAAEWAYDADDDRFDDEAGLPMLLAAARRARSVLEAIRVPYVSSSWEGDADRRAGAVWGVKSDAAEASIAAGIIASLVRDQLTKDLRGKRGEATRLVVEASGDNQSEAGRVLGISQSNINSLIRRESR